MEIIKRVYLLKFLLLIFAAGSLTFCKPEDDDEGGGVVVGNNTQLTNSQSSLVSQTCDASSLKCSPSNLEGRIFAAGAMLSNDETSNRESNESGDEEEGGKSPEMSHGYNMTFLADSEDIINDPSEAGHPEGTLIFNLLEQTKFSGLISIPVEDQMPENPIILRIESFFDYIDATIEFPDLDEGLRGPFVIRTVFRATADSDDVDDTMQIKDKLVRLPDAVKFTWCDSSVCNYSTRPSGPLQDSRVKTLLEVGDTGPGNPNYGLFTINLQTPLTVDYGVISDSSKVWTIDFDLENTVKFTTTPSTWQTVADLVSSFNIAYYCSNRFCSQQSSPGEDYITASLKIED
ncbi:MAG: hypothetical protein AB8G05_19850 [Oligoflexales bacterium]